MGLFEQLDAYAALQGEAGSKRYAGCTAADDRDSSIGGEQVLMKERMG
ncbi:hypothetical protein SAMCCGM7_pB0013 (plasmid) [Sinorhizobium americanum CCGM7]|nr:hypothetical protein SAMCCGM7_pB0013 [Sinorhizobium americanum CCGM7]